MITSRYKTEITLTYTCKMSKEKAQIAVKATADYSPRACTKKCNCKYG